jgi:hypothetical protein
MAARISVRTRSTLAKERGPRRPDDDQARDGLGLGMASHRAVVAGRRLASEDLHSSMVGLVDQREDRDGDGDEDPVEDPEDEHTGKGHQRQSEVRRADARQAPEGGRGDEPGRGDDHERGERFR